MRACAGSGVRRSFSFPLRFVSDDLLSLRGFPPLLGTRGGTGKSLPLSRTEKPDLYLARLFDCLQTFQIAALYLLFLALCFSALVFLPKRSGCERDLVPLGGRSPPLSVLV